MSESEQLAFHFLKTGYNVTAMLEKSFLTKGIIQWANFTQNMVRYTYSQHVRNEMRVSFTFICTEPYLLRFHIEYVFACHV